MLYASGQDWRDAKNKRVVVFAMSGLGKTHLSQMLRDNGDWFHYSIDYRIGTRYMGEYIIDNAKAEAMKIPFLRDLLLKDSIFIGSNITFSNLSPVASYLGKPGDPEEGGVRIEEYQRRQAQFRTAEIAALNDTGYFIERAERLYDYPNFICDTGGSICEWVNGNDPDDTLLQRLSGQAVLLWIQGTEDHTQKLIRRFDKAPKPMAYQPEFLAKCWDDYLEETGAAPEKVNPDNFIRWTYAKALAHRQPRYAAMSKWGVTVTAQDVETIQSAADFVDLVANAIDNKI